MLSKILSGQCSVLIFVLLISTISQAQDDWSWPEKTENIQVLPKEWPGKRLQPVMTGFTRALGVRCSYCHVGEEGEPLSTYDFASDENPNKDRAREMLRMLGSINEHLDYIEISGDQPVNMWCHTCHRGRARPMTLSEEMGEAYRVNGSEAALIRYNELKENYYGKGVFNFESENELNNFGYEILGEDDAKGAISVFELNTKKFPESGNVWDSLAEAYMKAGDNVLAEKYYKKSLELNPGNQNAQDMLEKLKE
jgi:tetratricopeptide (TPR) repeat protein